MWLRIVRDIIAAIVGSQTFPEAVQESIGQSQGLYAAAQAEYTVAAALEDKRIDNKIDNVGCTWWGVVSATGIT